MERQKLSMREAAASRVVPSASGRPQARPRQSLFLLIGGRALDRSGQQAAAVQSGYVDSVSVAAVPGPIASHVSQRI